MELVKPVIFQIADGYFGIDINRVQAIELYSEIVPVPSAVAYVDGLINIRGEVIPVYNLRKRAGIPGEIEDITAEQFIVVNCNGEKLAIMVDFVESIKDVKEENYRPLPIICRNADNKYVQGIMQLGNNLAMIVNVDELLSSDEMERLAKVVEREK